ncbi:MAG: hypothetical protein ABI766_06410 [Gemmatimonadales bacterium]
MRLLIDGDVHADIGEAHRAATQIIERAVNARLGDYGIGVDVWSFTPIIFPPGARRGHPEVKRYDRDQRRLECRLVIPFEQYRHGSPGRRCGLLSEGLLRSLEFGWTMRIPAFDWRAAAADFRAIARDEGWLTAA